jgi:hypothetical protein
MSSYPRDQFTAYPEIVITRDLEAPRVRWIARIYTYKPVGFMWRGAMLAEWPENLPQPEYPEFPHNGTREQISAWRAKCKEISDSHPQAYHVIDFVEGYVEAADIDAADAEARKASQEWVAECMNNFRR